MKEAEDTLIKATAIIAKAEAIRPVPATTPAMMEHYRRYLQLGHTDKDLLVGTGFAVLGPGLTADVIPSVAKETKMLSFICFATENARQWPIRRGNNSPSAT